MSLLTLGSVGVGRDLANTGDPVTTDAVAHRPRRTQLARAAHGAPAEHGSTGTAADVATFGQLLVAQIPSEALLAYTTILALFAAAGPDRSYKAGRWVVYVGAILVSAAGVLASYTSQRHYRFADKHPHADGQEAKNESSLTRLHLPLLPMASAVVSMAIYRTFGARITFAVRGFRACVHHLGRITGSQRRCRHVDLRNGSRQGKRRDDGAGQGGTARDRATGRDRGIARDGRGPELTRQRANQLAGAARPRREAVSVSTSAAWRSTLRVTAHGRMRAIRTAWTDVRRAAGDAEIVHDLGGVDD